MIKDAKKSEISAVSGCKEQEENATDSNKNGFSRDNIPAGR